MGVRMTEPDQLQQYEGIEPGLLDYDYNALLPELRGDVKILH